MRYQGTNAASWTRMLTKRVRWHANSIIRYRETYGNPAPAWVEASIEADAKIGRNLAESVYRGDPRYQPGSLLLPARHRYDWSHKP